MDQTFDQVRAGLLKDRQQLEEMVKALRGATKVNITRTIASGYANAARAKCIKLENALLDMRWTDQERKELMQLGPKILGAAVYVLNELNY